jgi:hypothetical protein
METFDIRRIKSIVEYNLRKYRINSLEYKSNSSTADPTGIKGLITDDKKLNSWNQKSHGFKAGTKGTRYSIFETNYQLRDFLTQIIIDIFTGSETDGSYSKANERIYNIKPTTGKSIQNKDKPFIIKRGNNTFEISDKGVFINGKQYPDPEDVKLF